MTVSRVKTLLSTMLNSNQSEVGFLTETTARSYLIDTLRNPAFKRVALFYALYRVN